MLINVIILSSEYLTKKEAKKDFSERNFFTELPTCNQSNHFPRFRYLYNNHRK